MWVPPWHGSVRHGSARHGTAYLHTIFGSTSTHVYKSFDILTAKRTSKVTSILLFQNPYTVDTETMTARCNCVKAMYVVIFQTYGTLIKYYNCFRRYGQFVFQNHFKVCILHDNANSIQARVRILHLINSPSLCFSSIWVLRCALKLSNPKYKHFLAKYISSGMIA